MRRLICLSLSAALPAGQAGGVPEPNPIHFTGFMTFASFERAVRSGTVVLTSPWFAPPRPWNELIASWNLTCPPGGSLKVEVRAARARTATPFYTLGLWSPNPEVHSRESVAGQKDSFGEVQTDTLICRERMERAQIRLTLSGDRELPKVKLLGVCASDTTIHRAAQPPNRAAWGQVIDVPQRSQLGHPGASGWCSPTCISMILAHWSGVLHRPELDVPVPDVARAVEDRNRPGTGNWPFNTAFAGQFEGLRGYVTRFADAREIEDWVAVGVPVAVSVSFDLLHGQEKDEGSGHLIVVVGFTENGDVVVNDPWPNPKQENSVRKIFSRQTLLRAWERSKHTVYLIYPQSLKTPANRLGHWME